MTSPVGPFDQSTYQVRCEWGVAGLARLAPSDVVVVVDALRFSSAVSQRTASGEEIALEDAAAWSINGAAVAKAAPGLVIAGCLRNAAAVAELVVALQRQRGDRVSVAVIPAGERVSREATADVRFAVEDQLAAGAIIEELGARGIDHTSPEAAVVGTAFAALRRAVAHLFAASGSGRELVLRGEDPVLRDATATNVDATVPVLIDGQFRGIHAADADTVRARMG